MSPPSLTSPAALLVLAVVHALTVDSGQARRLHRARLVPQRLRRLHAQPDALHRGGRAHVLDGAVLGVRALVRQRRHLRREEARDADAHDAADERQEPREEHLRQGGERRGGSDGGLEEGRTDGGRARDFPTRRSAAPGLQIIRQLLWVRLPA